MDKRSGVQWNPTWRSTCGSWHTDGIHTHGTRQGHGGSSGGQEEMWEIPGWLSGKESACQCRRHRFLPWVGKIAWRRKWQPTPIFLPRKFQGQRILTGYSPWSCKRVEHNLVTKQQQQSLYMHPSSVRIPWTSLVGYNPWGHKESDTTK